MKAAIAVRGIPVNEPGQNGLPERLLHGEPYILTESGFFRKPFRHLGPDGPDFKAGPMHAAKAPGNVFSLDCRGQVPANPELSDGPISHGGMFQHWSAIRC
ncbi:MAG: hypothetical protein ABI790_01520 [Betaproteobacteria bacterium]